jgi:hypothetical protein
MPSDYASHVNYLATGGLAPWWENFPSAPSNIGPVNPYPSTPGYWDNPATLYPDDVNPDPWAPFGGQSYADPVNMLNEDVDTLMAFNDSVFANQPPPSLIQSPVAQPSGPAPTVPLLPSLPEASPFNNSFGSTNTSLQGNPVALSGPPPYLNTNPFSSGFPSPTVTYPGFNYGMPSLGNLTLGNNFTGEETNPFGYENPYHGPMPLPKEPTFGDPSMLLPVTTDPNIIGALDATTGLPIRHDPPPVELDPRDIHPTNPLGPGNPTIYGGGQGGLMGTGLDIGIPGLVSIGGLLGAGGGLLGLGGEMGGLFGGGQPGPPPAPEQPPPTTVPPPVVPPSNEQPPITVPPVQQVPETSPPQQIGDGSGGPRPPTTIPPIIPGGPNESPPPPTTVPPVIPTPSPENNQQPITVPPPNIGDPPAPPNIGHDGGGDTTTIPIPPTPPPPIIPPPPPPTGGGPGPTPPPTMPTQTLPLDRNYYREGNQTNQDNSALLPGIFQNYQNYSGGYGQTDQANFRSLLGALGIDNATLTGIANQQTAAGNTALRTGNVQDASNLGGQALGILQQLNPNMYGALNQTNTTSGTAGSPSDIQMMLEQQAREGLALGGQLSAEDNRLAQQAAREAWSARGLVNSNGAVADEVLNRDALSRQRLAERQALASAVDQQGFSQRQQGFGNQVQNSLLQMQGAFNPFQTITSANTQNQGSNQQLFSQGAGFSSGAFGNQNVNNLVNPFNPYAQDVYNSNFNAANARYISAGNNAAAMAGARDAATGDIANSFLRLIGNIYGAS